MPRPPRQRRPDAGQDARGKPPMLTALRSARRLALPRTGGRPVGGPPQLPAGREPEDYPPAGTSAAGEIGFTVIVNGALAAPWLSGPPGIFTRTTSAPGSKNDWVIV